MKMVQLKILNSREIIKRIEEYNTLQEGKTIIYISGAITTGLHFLEWFLKYGKFIENAEEYKQHHCKEVITKNIAVILDYAEKLRKEEKRVVVEPASFDVAGWTQPDYLYYWELFITKYVRKIVFLDGWNYSKGCIWEYYIGLMDGIELVDQSLKPLNRELAILKIESAIAEFEKNKIEVEFQKTVLSEIKK